MIDISAIVDELLSGSGYYVIPDFISRERAEKLERFVIRATSKHNDNVRERRVWNLDTSSLFDGIANHHTITSVYDVLLGNRHNLSSYGANCMLPNAQAQEPHTDYPYWGLHDKKTLPYNINSSFVFAAQAIVPLTDYTDTNGATEIVPYSQQKCEYPSEKEFDDLSVKVLLNKGDLLLYNSLLWHRAGENKSDSPRVALLMQYTSGFVKDFI